MESRCYETADLSIGNGWLHNLSQAEKHTHPKADAGRDTTAIFSFFGAVDFLRLMNYWSFTPRKIRLFFRNSDFLYCLQAFGV